MRPALLTSFLVPPLAMLALACGFGSAQAAVGAPGAIGAVSAAPAPIVKAEYFCSPGYEPSYGGTCVAVPSRSEVEVFIDQPIFGVPEAPRYVRHRRHHGLRERY